MAIFNTQLVTGGLCATSGNTHSTEETVGSRDFADGVIDLIVEYTKPTDTTE